MSVPTVSFSAVRKGDGIPPSEKENHIAVQVSGIRNNKLPAFLEALTMGNNGKFMGYTIESSGNGEATITARLGTIDMARSYTDSVIKILNMENQSNQLREQLKPACNAFIAANAPAVA